MNFPDMDPGNLPTSCALDVADLGGATLEDVGAIVNLTRERVRQIEVSARIKMKTSPADDVRLLEEMAREMGEPNNEPRPALPFRLPVLP